MAVGLLPLDSVDVAAFFDCPVHSSSSRDVRVELFLNSFILALMWTVLGILFIPHLPVPFGFFPSLSLVSGVLCASVCSASFSSSELSFDLNE